MRPGNQWVQATVVARKGPVTYLVRLPTGECWKRHIDHLLACGRPTSRNNQDVEQEVTSTPSTSDDLPLTPYMTHTTDRERELGEVGRSVEVPEMQGGEGVESGRRYPLRSREPPDRYT